jgi:hypothetical protein
MAAQVRPIGSIAFASGLFASALGAGAPIDIAVAADCLTAPNSSAPPNSHWYYRTDRTQQLKCWYLRSDNGSLEQGAVQPASGAPARPSQSAAAVAAHAGPDSKELMAQREGAKLPEQAVDKLYGEFLEWQRRNKN